MCDSSEEIAATESNAQKIFGTTVKQSHKMMCQLMHTWLMNVLETLWAKWKFPLVLEFMSVNRG